MPDPMLPQVPLRRARVPAAETPRSEGLLGLAVGVVAVAALYFAREVLVPITLAVLLSFVLAPLVHLLRRVRVPRVPAVLLSVLAALTTILLLGGVIGTQLDGLAHDLPQYQSTIEHKVSSVRSYLDTHMTEVRSRFGVAVQGAGHPAQGSAGPATANEQAPMPVRIVGQESPLSLMQRVLSPVLSPIETLGVVFVVAIFILMQQEDLRDRLIRLFGSSDLHRTTLAIDDAGRRLSRYFLTQLAVNASFGVIVGVGLTLIGVPNPVLWGILGALLRFVPYIGSTIAGVLPVALAAAVDPGWSMALWAAALFIITEMIIGQVVEPLLYGHSTGLSPVAVIVVAIFWSWLWGPIGLILSTPITLCLVVLGRHVKRLEFIDVMLGDRPALTSIESFYQRMLAGDPDEVQEQAEVLLKARSLSSYYDEVALKALQLAAADMQRNVLQPEQVEALHRSILELVSELDSHDDADPVSPRRTRASPEPSVPTAWCRPIPPPRRASPPTPCPPAWRGPSAVLCVAGRGALDEAAAAMLAQLLGKHGLGARVVPHGDVSRSNIGDFDFSGVAMICVSYLELSGNASHLRYLLRRLRQHAPSAKLLVGLWPTEASFDEEDVRAELRADFYAASLRAAVTDCIAAAQQEEPAMVAGAA